LSNVITPLTVAAATDVGVYAFISRLEAGIAVAIATNRETLLPLQPGVS